MSKAVGNHLGLYYSTINTIATNVAKTKTPRKKTPAPFYDGNEV